MNGESSVAREAARDSMRRWEQRRHGRAHFTTEVNWHSDSNFYTGFTHDISEGGVFIASYLSEPVGTVVSLEIGFPGALEIKTTGIVRWVRDPRDLDADESQPPGMGIEFLSLTPEDRAIIHEFVWHRTPLFHPG